MLQLAGRVALGVDVADFLELERALERGRVGVAATDEHEAARVDVAAREVRRSPRRSRAPAPPPRAGARSAAPSSCSCSMPERAARLGDGRGEDHQRRDLGHERLRRRDRDLRPGLEEQDRSASRVIAEPTVLVTAMTGRAALAGEAGRRDRVGGLARLGDGDDERPLVDRRRAVAELGADRRPGRDADPVLDRGRADQRRVVRRAAGDQLDPVDRAERLVEALELLEPDVVARGSPGPRSPGAATRAARGSP